MAIEIKERYTTAVISTAHISKDDAVLLTEASYNPRSESGRNWIHANEYGYLIRITCDNQEWKQHLRDDGISWPTIENIEKVLNAGFECVHFDRDADIVDELIAWDW
ncbi:TPA: hypothetical protein R4W97_004735 [Klebsiella pneumoniae]|nr:hypothetical protein [Klebsiella pneumoniae]